MVISLQASKECIPTTTTATTDRRDTTSSEAQSRSRRSFSQPVSVDDRSGTSFNPNLDLTDNSAVEAFSNERHCLELFEKLLIGIPQEMCYLSKPYAITNVLNKQCWTGNSVNE